MPSTTSAPANRAIPLVRQLAQAGDRLFTSTRAQELAREAGLSPGYVHQALHHLTRAGWIVRLRRGLYSLSPQLFHGLPLDELEIAMALVQPAAISHWSAFSYHELTEQLPRRVHVLTTTEASIPREHKSTGGEEYPLDGGRYKFIQVIPSRFFGTQPVWVGDSQVTMTDLERTLLDGLERPRYCGDFSEVLHAFEVARDGLDRDKIIDYALRLHAAAARRLGWVLEHVGVPRAELTRLADVPMKGYRVLDPSGPRRGPHNGFWMIQENLPGRSAS